jgi:hypothetical protein
MPDDSIIWQCKVCGWHGTSDEMVKFHCPKCNAFDEVKILIIPNLLLKPICPIEWS